MTLEVWVPGPPHLQSLIYPSVNFWLEHPLFLIFVAHVVKKGASRSFQPKTLKSDKFHGQRVINRNPR